MRQRKASLEDKRLFQTYFGIDVDSIADPVGRNATRTMIKTYGQTPKQLFRHVHPSPHVSGREGGLRGYAKSQVGDSCTDLYRNV